MEKRDSSRITDGETLRAFDYVSQKSFTAKRQFEQSRPLSAFLSRSEVDFRSLPNNTLAPYDQFLQDSSPPPRTMKRAYGSAVFYYFFSLVIS